MTLCVRQGDVVGGCSSVRESRHVGALETAADGWLWEGIWASGLDLCALECRIIRPNCRAKRKGFAEGLESAVYLILFGVDRGVFENATIAAPETAADGWLF